MTLLRKVVTGWSGMLGLALLTAVLLVALLGPIIAPNTPTEISCIPFDTSRIGLPLGCDAFGHDVLSRLLHGGRTVVLLGVASTVLAYLSGATLGLLAGFRGGRLDAVLMRGVDVLLAFPPILLLLVLATGAGFGVVTLLVGIVLVQLPGIARVVRAATLETATRSYVEAATARGERVGWIVRREILPNIVTPLMADGGTRLTASILLVAAMNFLGLGLRPPAADWALMISENRSGLTLQPLAVVAPAAMIALLTIAVNLVADSAARAGGRSLDVTALRR